MKLNDEIRKNDPFRVPDGYFESLADRTMAAIRDEEAGRENEKETDGHFTVRASGHSDENRARTGRTISLRPFLSLAAAILGFALLAAVVVRLATADRQAEGYRAGSSLYADLVFEEVDTYMLESELSLTEPEAAEIKSDDISTESIIDYLMSEGIDINDIYELL